MAKESCFTLLEGFATHGLDVACFTLREGFAIHWFTGFGFGFNFRLRESFAILIHGLTGTGFRFTGTGFGFRGIGFFRIKGFFGFTVLLLLLLLLDILWAALLGLASLSASSPSAISSNDAHGFTLSPGCGSSSTKTHSYSS